MLPKQNRLQKRRDFDFLLKKGKRFYSPNLALTIAKTVGHKPARLAFVISAKTEKTAVKRNRAKRQLREIIRKSYSPLWMGTDASFFIKKGFLFLNPDQQKKEVDLILKKARLI